MPNIKPGNRPKRWWSRCSRWWSRWSRAQQAGIIAAIIVAVSTVVAATIQTVPGLISLSSSNGRTINHVQNGKPIVVDDLYAGQDDFLALVYPQEVQLNPAQLANPHGSGVLARILARSVMGEQEFIGLTVSGGLVTPVTIDNIEIQKTCLAPIVRHATMFWGFYGAGVLGVTTLYFNLDQRDPAGERLDYFGRDRGRFFDHYVVSFKLHEQHTFHIMISASLYCKFYIRLSVATSNGPAVETISNHGKPFMITGVPKHGFCPVFGRYADVYMFKTMAIENFRRVNPSRISPIVLRNNAC